MSQNKRSEVVKSLVFKLIWIAIAIAALAGTIPTLYVPVLFNGEDRWGELLLVGAILFTAINFIPMKNLIKGMINNTRNVNRGQKIEGKLISTIFMFILGAALCAFVGPVITLFTLIRRVIEAVKLIAALRNTAAPASSESEKEE